MTEIEIGRAKRGRRAYSFDDIAIVPSRRTRDPEEVSTAWQIDAYRFDIPVLAAPMDSVMSPDTAVAMGRQGGLGVLDLEGLWTRYEDPQSVLDQIGALEDQTNSPAVTRRMQELYQAPIQPELITSRLAEIRAAGVTVAGSLTPQRTQEHYKTVVAAGVESATATLQGLGFVVVTEQAPGFLGLGFVFSMDPDAGSSVPRGSTITLYLI